MKYENNYTHFYHEGIDFRASVNTSIYSFICGEIIAYGKRGDYGDILLIKNIENTRLYLLAHLSKNDMYKEGTKVSPGMIVAKSGTTGTSNPHLHISVFDIENSIIASKDEAGNIKWKTEIWDKVYMDTKTLNPFFQINTRYKNKGKN